MRRLRFAKVLASGVASVLASGLADALTASRRVFLELLPLKDTSPVVITAPI